MKILSSPTSGCVATFTTVCNSHTTHPAGSGISGPQHPQACRNQKKVPRGETVLGARFTETRHLGLGSYTLASSGGAERF